MRRAKRTKRARHTRAKLEGEARRLAEDASRLHYEVFLFERDHLDRYEREAIERASTSISQAGRALTSLATSLGRPAGRRP